MASEDSLSLTVVFSLNANPIWRGSRGRGEHGRAVKVSGGGSGRLLERNQEGIKIRDYEGGGGRRRSRVGGRRKSNAEITTYGYIVVSKDITK